MAGERAIKSFSPQDNACFFGCFFPGQHCTTNSFGATRSPSPVPSLSLCRLALAGGGTVKFQHLLRRTPNYYTLLLRPPPTAPPAPRGARQRALGRGLRKGGGRPTPPRLGLSASCAVSLLQAPTRRSAGASQTLGSTHTVELSPSTFLHTAPSSPRAPGVAERGRVTGASRQPAPGRAGRSGARGQLRRVFRRPRRWRGAEPEFRKRRGWLSSMKSYS